MKKQERTSTFLAALGDLPSPPDGQDTEQSPSASRTDSAKESSNDTGQTSPSPTTSTTSTEETMRESPSSQVDFLANHSVQPGSDEARRMTARSGRKWLALLTRQDPLGYLARTLLVSSRWASTTCFLTWKAWDTPSKRSLYRLAPSMPRTEETASGLWATPNTMDHRTDVRKPEERSDKANKGGCANLREQVVHPKMWPTPTAMEHVDGGTNFKSLAKVDKGGRILRRIATLTLAGKIPDPRTADQVKLLPTPCTRDWKGASGRAYKGEAIDLPSVVGGSLNPTWVEWLMGYPIGWTDSRDLGTQSCPKSPTSSSD